MTERVRIICPNPDPGILSELECGTPVLLSGTVLTARDAAHVRLHRLITEKKPLPVNLVGQVLYYVGPAPASPGHAVGSAGPTTAGRMDPYTPELLELGVRATIGKGYRSEAVRQTIMRIGSIYLGAIGGLGAKLSQSIRSQRVVAFEDLGPESIYELEIVDFPAIVLIDAKGRDFYRINQARYRRDG